MILHILYYLKCINLTCIYLYKMKFGMKLNKKKLMQQISLFLQKKTYFDCSTNFTITRMLLSLFVYNCYCTTTSN